MWKSHTLLCELRVQVYTGGGRLYCLQYNEMLDLPAIALQMPKLLSSKMNYIIQYQNY